MPEPLKNIYTLQRLKAIAKVAQEHDANFSQPLFISKVFQPQWSSFELKQRQAHISQCFEETLSGNYLQQLNTVCLVAKSFGNHQKEQEKVQEKSTEILGNFEYMIFPTFVEMYGIHYPEYFVENMQALELLTQYSSSEFAIRPFILQRPKDTMAIMRQWSQHENYHVRRLASEGCRPRLPWAMALKPFQQDPCDVLTVLENLKNDDSLYVRRSVANNLNDISKDHPNTVLTLAQQWLNHNANTDWLIKHALRTLLKQGQPQALTLMGFKAPNHIQCTQLQCEPVIKLGDTLNFSAQLDSKEKVLGRCRIEFSIDFMKANGKQRRKVFKLSESELRSHHKHITKSFSFRPISTRKYYQGEHSLSIIVNGVTLNCCHFLLAQ